MLLKGQKIIDRVGAQTAIFLAMDDSVKNITGGYFYKCRIAKSSRRSKDKALAKRLYEFTEELINEA
jgi:hypothetical protein